MSEPKWHRQPDERPAQIIEAALDSFAEKGFHAATMDEIALAAGITKGTIYLYFPSKEELFVAMARHVFQQALDLAPEIEIDLSQEPEAMFRDLAGKFLELLMSPQVVKIAPLIIAEANHIPALRKLYQEEILPAANIQLADLLELGMNLGMFRRVEPLIAARSLFGMFFVFVLTQEIFGAKEITPMRTEAIVDTVATIYFHGLLKEDASS